MPITFNNIDSQYALAARRAVRAWLEECIVREGCVCGQVNFVFCSDAHLLDMNRQFLGHDYFTDVITFQYGAQGEAAGDVYISVDTVRDNARSFGATARGEMLRVVLHGVLHLCGHGDKTPAEEKAMRAREDFYLDRLPSDIKTAARIGRAK